MSDNNNLTVPEIIQLPSNIQRFETTSGILYIAPDIGSAILTNEIGDVIIAKLKETCNVEKTFEYTCQHFNDTYTKDIIMKAFTKLIGQINIEQFMYETEAYYLDFHDVEKALHIYITEKCNLSCIHCYNAYNHPKTELTLEQYIEIIDFFAPYIMKVNISGGEPMHSDIFYSLVEYIKKKYPLMKLSLFTNGTYIDSQKTADRIGRFFEEVQVSLDGASLAVVDSIRGNGTFNRVIQGLSYLSNTDIEELAISICLFKTNIDDLSNNLIPLLEEIDPQKQIKSIRFAKIELEGRADSTMPYDSQDINAATLLANLQKIISESGRRVWDRLEEISFREYNVFNKAYRRRLPNTCSFGQTLVIDSNGDIYPCAFRKQNGKLGNFFEFDKQNLLNDWNICFSNHTVNIMEPCKNCPVRYFCCGGCKIQNYSKTGSFAIKSCSDDIVKEQIDKIAKDIQSRYSKDTATILKQKPVL